MKKFIIYFIGCLLISSCSDFLDENPKGQQTSENFYNNDSEALAALLGCYKDATSQLAITSVVCRQDARSDLFTYKPDAVAEAKATALYNVTPEMSFVSQTWNTMYEGINRCNSLLDGISGKDVAQIKNKEQYIAEAKFLRAYYYFHLVTCFGDVPLRTTSIGIDNNIERTSKEKIWTELIIPDLESAITPLPEASFPQVNNTRITKGAALLLLAKAYLQHNGDYAKAYEVLKQIKGYELVPILDIFNCTKKFNNESIWEINNTFGVTPKTSNAMIVNYAPMVQTFKNANATFPLNDYFMSKTEENSPRTLRFYATKAKIEDDNYGKITYTNNDGVTKVLTITKATNPKLATLIKVVDIANYENGINVAGADCGFNIILFRYADVVLLKAECECELNGKTDEALSLLNSIRSRAGETLYSYTNEPGKKFIQSEEELIEAIRDERALELVGEGWRFYDLLRWGNEYALKKLKESRLFPTIEGTRDCFTSTDVNSIEEYKLLLPIPYSEKETNDLMEQNPGY